MAGTLVPSLEPRAPSQDNARSSSNYGLSAAQISTPGKGLGNPDGDGDEEPALDLSYAGGSEADMSDTDRAMAARFSSDEGEHCKKNCAPAPFHGLVVRTIPPSSAEFHSSKGRAAIAQESSDLPSDVTWDESTVSEWSEVIYPHVQLALYHNGPKEF